mmetsp:Transcript_22507/g.44611  ORF Transcript_22507/g.44611 Transcript_22507/m.44611 type:complete len:118 (+) Transcript_22507:199-552(+)
MSTLFTYVISCSVFFSAFLINPPLYSSSDLIPASSRRASGEFHSMSVILDRRRESHDRKEDALALQLAKQLKKAHPKTGATFGSFRMKFHRRQRASISHQISKTCSIPLRRRRISSI